MVIARAGRGSQQPNAGVIWISEESRSYRQLLDWVAVSTAGFGLCREGLLACWVVLTAVFWPMSRLPVSVRVFALVAERAYSSSVSSIGSHVVVWSAPLPSQAHSIFTGPSSLAMCAVPGLHMDVSLFVAPPLLSTSDRDCFGFFDVGLGPQDRALPFEDSPEASYFISF